MDEIKVVEGEYVKTKTGKITRLIKIDKKYVVVGHGIHELQVYSKFENSHYIYANNYEELYEKINKYITKHSFDIKELLGKGDYVNGHQIVDEVYGEDDNDLYFEIEGGYNQAKCIKENEIETILTKEQYERECYRLEDN